MEQFIRGGLGTPVGPPGTSTGLGKGPISLPSRPYAPGLNGFTPAQAMARQSIPEARHDPSKPIERHDGTTDLSQDQVTMQYTLKSFPVDHREQYISVGDPVFTVRSKQAGTGSHTVMDLAGFNDILRMGYEQGMVSLERHKTIKQNQGSKVNLLDTTADRIYTTDPVDNSAFISFMDGLAPVKGDMVTHHAPPPTEMDELKEIIRTYQMTPGFKKAKLDYLQEQLKSAQDAYENELEVDKFWKQYKNNDKKGVKFLTMGFIRHRFNFLGIVSTSPNEAGVGNQATKGGITPTIAVVIEKKLHTIYNYWGNALRKSDFLFFIVKRVKRNGEYAEFACLPWSKGRMAPTEEDTIYEDIFGNLQTGWVIKVGSINRSLRGVVVPQRSIELAAGLVPGTSMKECYDTKVAHLRLFEGSVRM